MWTVGEHVLYKETFKQLYHGTTCENYNEIMENGFTLSTAKNNWCGEGVYFYDIKAKAWWAAERKCRQVKSNTGKSHKSIVAVVDIIDLPRESIFDLRTHQDLCVFQHFVESLLVENSKWRLVRDGQEMSQEKILLRALFISFFAQKHCKKLVVGNFMQLPNTINNNIIPFVSDMNLAFGIETIYCVKDIGVISNIR